MAQVPLRDNLLAALLQVWLPVLINTERYHIVLCVSSSTSNEKSNVVSVVEDMAFRITFNWPVVRSYIV